MSGESCIAAADDPAWTRDTPEPVPIKLDKFPKLTGQADYRTWRGSAEFILQTMGCWGLVGDNEQEPTKEDVEENDAYEDRVNKYRYRYRWTSVFILEIVDFKWLRIITVNKMPSLIWKALQDQFHRENTISFHSPFTSDTAANCYHTSYPPSKTTPSTGWIYDTGTSSYLTNNVDLFLNIQPYHNRVR